FGLQHFECCTFDHSDNSPCIQIVERSSQNFKRFLLQKATGKKNRQERYEILKFDPAKPLINQGFSAEETARANAHFECCTFDHSDNSPCISVYILFWKKARQHARTI
ncbi:MAG: hypothetical protein II036_03630, partial [Oscillospiraceae bacterium]|nr:hypothetical protein [Oscillospiraceae bacterium]